MAHVSGGHHRTTEYEAARPAACSRTARAVHGAGNCARSDASVIVALTDDFIVENSNDLVALADMRATTRDHVWTCHRGPENLALVKRK